MSRPTRKLKVEGLSSDASKVRLVTFFRNEQCQGGGTVDDVIISGDKSSAIIIFKEPEAVEMILDRGATVVMSNSVLKVSRFYDMVEGDHHQPQVAISKEINAPTTKLSKDNDFKSTSSDVFRFGHTNASRKTAESQSNVILPSLKNMQDGRPSLGADGIKSETSNSQNKVISLFGKLENGCDQAQTDKKKESPATSSKENKSL